MTNEQKCNIGVIGLGVMGTSLAKNMINHGFCTALYSVSDQERKRFESGEQLPDFRQHQRIHFEPGKAEKSFSYDYGR